MELVLSALTGILHLVVTAVVVGPLAWWQARRQGKPLLAKGATRALGIGSAIYIAAFAVLNLPRVGPFVDLAWNWQNKLLLLAALAILVTVWRDLTWQEVGVVTPNPGWWRPVLAVTAATVGFQLLVGPMGDFELSAETVAFQALVPGLDEELLFRGVLLVLFDRALRARRKMWGGEVGWAAAITTLLFGLVHGLHIEAGPILAVDPVAIISTGGVGLLLVWIRISTASLWPAILLHNAINSSVVAVIALTQ